LEFIWNLWVGAWNLITVCFQQRPNQIIGVELQLKIVGAVRHGKEIDLGPALKPGIRQIDLLDRVFLPVPKELQGLDFPVPKQAGNLDWFIDFFYHKKTAP
jgi:hypothetical protein